MFDAGFEVSWWCLRSSVVERGFCGDGGIVNFFDFCFIFDHSEIAV